MILSGMTLSRAKRLGSFSIGFIIERILTGFLPLIILLLSNSGTYTRLEFIFSLSTFFLPVSDFFTRMFLLYGYSESEDRTKFLKLSFSVFCGQLIVIALISLVLVLMKEANLVYAMVRLGYLSLYYFLFDYLRLHNKQGQIIRDSILVNCSIIIYAAIDYFFLHSDYIFLCIAFIQLTYIVLRLKSERAMISVWPFHEIKKYLKHSLLYSFPVFINVSIAVFIQNYLKVHFYHTDDKQSMFVLSLLIRLGLSIQIIHALIQSYFTKKIFLKELSFKKFLSLIYLPLLIATALTISLAEVVYFTYLNPSFHISGTIILLVNLYFLVWCTSAIVEILFSSRNKNMWLLGINLFSLACTFLIFVGFHLNQSKDLRQLVALMSCQPLLFILLVMIFYKKVFKKTALLAYET
jgi:hypothetical protein